MSEPPKPAGARPFDGLVVLECTTFLAGPFAGAILAEFGAIVIKIEQPGSGDPFRKFGTPTERGDSLTFLSESRNKSSITLDLRQPKGADLFKRLVARADVVMENFRPGTLEKWGLGYPVLAAVNPRLVMLHISGYGQTGPYRDRPGFARIAHAFGGLTHLAGLPGGPPVTPGSTSLADYMTGLYGVIGMLAALRHRDATGEGQEIDAALYESAFRVLDELAPAFARIGKVRGPEGIGTTNACPHGHFECGDGAWVAIACTTDKMFERLTQAMGQPDLARPDRYGLVARRLQARAEVDGLVQAWTRAMARAAVIDKCLASEVPVGPINTIADIFADPHYQARGNLVPVAAVGLGEIVLPGVVPRLSRTPGRIDHVAPALGHDNERIYGELLGLRVDELAALRVEKVI
ncbi:MAG: CoA transferase [Alphaproteobacteria bacterium]|nr:CoA transferase [Alphaproteobacteria bacterium]